jgi:hypothetical protein
MPNRMTQFVPAILVTLFAAAFLTARPSVAQRAADACITKPNSEAPQGSHWYYRVDRAVHRQCWFLEPTVVKLRTRQAASSIPLPSPRPTLQPTLQPTAASPAEATAGENDGVAALSMRRPDLSNSAAAIDREPASMNNGYAAEHSTTDPQDDMPLQRPVLITTDLPAAERQPEATIRSEHVLGFLAGALALAAMILQTIFKLATAPRRGRRNLRDQRAWQAAAPRLRKHVPPAFAKTVTAARQADVVRKAVAATRRTDLAREASNPSDPSHDIEASLRQLLRDWERAAA